MPVTIVERLRHLSSNWHIPPFVQSTLEGLHTHLRNSLNEADDLESAYLGFVIGCRMMEEDSFVELDKICQALRLSRAELFTLAISLSEQP